MTTATHLRMAAPNAAAERFSVVTSSTAGVDERVQSIINIATDEVVTRGEVSRVGVTAPAGTLDMTFPGEPCTSPHPPTCYLMRDINTTLTTDAAATTPTAMRAAGATSDGA